MCIPCVMCGACMETPDENGSGPDLLCPECGCEVSPDNVSCPSCYAFLPRNARIRAEAAEDQNAG